MMKMYTYQRTTCRVADTRAEDYLLSERVSNVSYLSNSTLDMTDDTARRSRGRDQQLLRDATQAIVSTRISGPSCNVLLSCCCCCCCCCSCSCCSCSCFCCCCCSVMVLREGVGPRLFIFVSLQSFVIFCVCIIILLIHFLIIYCFSVYFDIVY